jgi:hypothetical protein
MKRQIFRLVICFILLSGCNPQSTILPSTTTSPLKIQTAKPTVPQTAQSTPTPIPTILPTPNLVLTLPAECKTAEVKGYQVSTLPNDLAAPSVLEQGRVILVTNNSDAINGDSSNVAALANNPGVDGISLREALFAIKADPGIYTIRFPVKLKGTTIEVGSWDHSTLPAWDDSSVIINGDVDGDNYPDITIENDVAVPRIGLGIFGFTIHSSHNTLHALKLTGFSNAILFDATSSGEIFTGNTISHMIIETPLGGGVGVGGGRDPIEERKNTWKDIKIIANNFKGWDGISIGLDRSAGDRIENLTIRDNRFEITHEKADDGGSGITVSGSWGAESHGNTIENVLIANNTIEGNPWVAIGLTSGFGGSYGNAVNNVRISGNTIQIAERNSLSTFGIQVAAGFWVNKSGNTLSNILIDNNVIEGNFEGALSIASGSVGSSGNKIKGVIFADNHVKITKPVDDNGVPYTAVSIVNADGATSYTDPTYKPVTYPENNMLEDIWLTGNVIEGQGGNGINISSGCCGGRHNKIAGIYLIGNEIHGIYAGSGTSNNGIYVIGSGSGPGDEQVSADNQITRLIIQNNHIQEDNQRLEFMGQEFISGGITLVGGAQSEDNSLTDAWIVGNQVSAPVPGINILGGWGLSPGFISSDNTLASIRVWCNNIKGNLSLMKSFYPVVKGINLAGGYGLAEGNWISDIQVLMNDVMGTPDDVSIYNNAGTGGKNNVVEYSIK